MLQRSEFIEKMGTGIQRMMMAMKDAGLPEPEFEVEDYFIVSWCLLISKNKFYI
jgi:ATP-dependent DNA helicase RecG